MNIEMPPAKVKKEKIEEPKKVEKKEKTLFDPVGKIEGSSPKEKIENAIAAVNFEAQQIIADYLRVERKLDKKQISEVFLKEKESKNKDKKYDTDETDTHYPIDIKEQAIDSLKEAEKLINSGKTFDVDRAITMAINRLRKQAEKYGIEKYIKPEESENEIEENKNKTEQRTDKIKEIDKRIDEIKKKGKDYLPAVQQLESVKDLLKKGDYFNKENEYIDMNEEINKAKNYVPPSYN